MNKEVNLSITTLKVEIKVLALDGKRFTKSVFDQLPLLAYSKYLKGGCDLIGYVDVRGRWYLFVSNGILYRANIRSWTPIVDFNEPKPSFMGASHLNLSKITDEMNAWSSRKEQAERAADDVLIQAMAKIKTSVSVKDQIFIST